MDATTRGLRYAMLKDPGFLRALADFQRALGALPAPSMLIGGVAVIAHGVGRFTDDADAVVWNAGVEFEEVIRVMSMHGIQPRPAKAFERARSRHVLLLEHVESGTPLDVSLAWLPFEREAIERAERVDFQGVDVRLARVEDLLLYKFVAWRDQDRTDIERLLIRHGHSLDLESLRDLMKQFAEALDDPGRPAQFEAILRRALGAKAEGG